MVKWLCSPWPGCRSVKHKSWQPSWPLRSALHRRVPIWSCWLCVNADAGNCLWWEKLAATVFDWPSLFSRHKRLHVTRWGPERKTLPCTLIDDISSNRNERSSFPETADNYLFVSWVICLSSRFSVPGEYMHSHYWIKCVIWSWSQL